MTFILSASCINIPYDVAKSRIQSLGGLPGGSFHGMGVHKVMAEIARVEGQAALFAGLAAKLLRLCPAGGVMMMMNEVVYEYLTTNYPLQ
jgi:solute carrier family 25 2-oxodicarboxylate transporter 21